MVTDQMIRDALDRVADRSPDSAAVRSALATAVHVHRQRRTLVLVGGAAAATAAAGVPAALWLRRDDARIAPGPGAADTTNRQIPVPWRPTWLPDGLVELYRSADFDGAEVTEWTRGWGPHPADDPTRKGLPAVALGSRREAELPDIGRPVSVNGRPGRLHNDAGAPECGVLWLASGWLLTASVTKMSPTHDPEETALRVARSVVEDPPAVCEESARFGWVLPGLHSDRRSFRLGASLRRRGAVPPEVRIEELSTTGPEGSLFLTVGGRPPQRPDGAEPATVRGRPGWAAWRERSRSEVYVALEDGRPFAMAVQAGSRNGQLPWTRADLIRMANDVRLGPPPDLSWVGRR